MLRISADWRLNRAEASPSTPAMNCQRIRPAVTVGMNSRTSLCMSSAQRKLRPTAPMAVPSVIHSGPSTLRL
ncbi:hypothetical protein FQZ97_1153260 [compost metagenome]